MAISDVIKLEWDNNINDCSGMFEGSKNIH